MATKKAKAKKREVAKAAKPKTDKEVTPPARKTPKGSFDRIKFAGDMLKYREKQGWSIMTVQLETGIAKTTWQGIEAAQKDVTADSVARICHVAKLKPADYFKL